MGESMPNSELLKPYHWQGCPNMIHAVEKSMQNAKPRYITSE